MTRAKTHRLCCLGVVAACLSSVVTVRAESQPPPPAPALSTIFPAGGKRGGPVEVLVNGANLANPVTARFHGGKVGAEIAPAEKPNPNSVKLKVNIPADAELGEHELRLITPGGVSNCLRFVVSDLAELIETEPNSELSQAQKLDVGQASNLPAKEGQETVATDPRQVGNLPHAAIVVNGQIGGEDRDYFRFAARAGQTFVFEVRGRRLRPFIQVDERVGWFDPCLALFDTTGKELQFVDDFRFDPDPMLAYTFQQDGEYVVCVRDAMYRGRPEFIYRLTIGPVPYVTHYFPPGGPRQSELKLQLTGVNVPGETTVQLPPNPADAHVLRVARDGASSNPVPLAVGDWPEAADTEPNDTREQAQRVTPPVTFNGRIEKPGDSDCVIVTAQKGQRFILETAARRFGSPLDSIVQVLNAQGAQVAVNDDAVAAAPEQLHRADARLDFTVPADGDYVVRVSDFLRRGGPEFVYRLTIAPPKPDFELRIRPTDPPLPNPRVTTVATIPRGVGAGGAVSFAIELVRKDGFAGDVTLTAPGLPPGFVLSPAPATIAANQNQTLLTLTAPEDTAVGALVPIELVGTAKIGDAEVRRTATALENHSYLSDQRALVPVREAVLSVTPAPPIRLSVGPPPARLVRSAKLELKVTVTRQPELKAPVTLNVQGLPGNVSAPPVTIPEDQTEATVTLNAAANAAVGATNIVVVGNMTIEKQAISQPAPAVMLTVAEK